MKLSLFRRFGFVHVRGGRALLVACDHQVPTGTQNYHDVNVKGAPSAARRFAEKWVTAHVGDLAVEIVAVKTDNVIGYAYISGDATQLNLYRADAPMHWFELARGWRADLNARPVEDPREMVAAVVACRFAAADVVCLPLELESNAQLKAAFRFIADALQLAPGDKTDVELEAAHPRTPHILAMLTVEGKKDKGAATVHLQPKRDQREFCASPFHIGLAMSARLVEVDPFTLAAP